MCLFCEGGRVWTSNWGGTVRSVVSGPSVALSTPPEINRLAAPRREADLQSFASLGPQHLRASLLCGMMSGLIYVLRSFSAADIDLASIAIIAI